MDEVSEDSVKRTADIVGPESAAAAALANAKLRRDRGEVVRFYKNGNTLFVRGETPQPNEASS